VRDVLAAEGRFAVLGRTDPEAAGHLAALAQADVDERWRLYEQLAGIERTVAHEEEIDGVHEVEELREDEASS
jgi:pyruvate-ferredoxin/flavodoxin oxidoreductase